MISVKHVSKNERSKGRFIYFRPSLLTQFYRLTAPRCKILTLVSTLPTAAAPIYSWQRASLTPEKNLCDADSVPEITELWESIQTRCGFVTDLLPVSWHLQAESSSGPGWNGYSHSWRAYLSSILFERRCSNYRRHPVSLQIIYKPEDWALTFTIVDEALLEAAKKVMTFATMTECQRPTTTSRASVVQPREMACSFPLIMELAKLNTTARNVAECLFNTNCPSHRGLFWRLLIWGGGRKGHPS